MGYLYGHRSTLINKDMEIQTHTQSIEVRMAYSLLYVPLTHGLVAYKLGQGPLPDQPSLPQLEAKLQLTVVEGIATMANLDKFLKGKAPFIKNENVELVHPALLEAMRKLGYNYAAESLSKGQPAVSNVPFTDITEKGADPKNIVRLDYGSHMVFNLDGESMPVAIHCDYIDAYMRDGAYHLEKAETILKADPRIRFVKEDARYGRHGTAEPESYIRTVPHYNSESGCSRYLEFWFMPTAEDAKKLWEQQKSYKAQFPSTEDHRAMFDLDILGLRAGGAAKYDDFRQSDEYADSDDD
jgi:hypothetical protein